MMASNFIPEYPSLRTALRRVNKIIKSWFAQSLPLSAASEFEIARAAHDKYWLKKEALEAQLANLDEYHAQSNKVDTTDKSLHTILTQCHISELQFNNELYRQNRVAILDCLNKLRDDHCGFGNEWKFTFCLYYDDKTDEDLQHNIQDLNAEQKRLSKYIISSLKETACITKDDSIALVNLCMNIYRILEHAQYGEEKSNFIQDYAWLANWIKMSLWILETGNELSLKMEPLYLEHESFLKDIIFSSLSITCFVNYISMTRILIDTAVSDLELLYTEQCLQTADHLFKRDVEKHIRRAPYKTPSENKLYALKGMVAYKNKEFARFLENIKQIKDSTGYCLITLDAWSLVGEYYQDKNPTLSLKYLKKSLDMLKTHLEVPLQSKMRDRYLALEKRYQEVEERNLSNLRRKLRETFANIKIRSTEKRDELYLFITLKFIPNNYQKLLSLSKLKHVRVQNVLDNVIDKQGNRVSGLQFITQSHYVDKILLSLKRCLNLFEQEFERIAAINRMVPQHKDETSNLVYQAEAFKEESVEAYPKIREPKSEKTRENTSSVGTIIRPPVLAPNIDCHASDFGFSVANNPLVTPVYFSEAGQRLRRPKLFVRFKGIPGVDETAERLFEGMLNPHPEGILTVGMVGQPGAKIWKHPDSLGSRWYLCALRFKRKGGAGWLRAVAEPEEKITVVNQDGETENRYLFSLGRPKHK